MSSRLGIVTELDRATRRVADPADQGQLLAVIVRAAQVSIPGIELAGISAADDRGQLHTTAATDDIVVELDNLQYQVEQGPCVDALRSADVITVPYVAHEQRWPRYTPHAARRGLKAQLAVQLSLGAAGPRGSLNLYSMHGEGLHENSVPAAQIFAAHAALTLGHAQEVNQLRTALESRTLIGQATGIIMERYHMDKERAFAYLVRASMHSNTKLHNVAQEVVDHAHDR